MILSESRARKSVLIFDSKSMINRKKRNSINWTSSKVKICSMVAHVKRMKRQAKELEKIFSNRISAKGLILDYALKISKLNDNKKSN